MPRFALCVWRDPGMNCLDALFILWGKQRMAYASGLSGNRTFIGWKLPQRFRDGIIRSFVENAWYCACGL